LFISVSIFYYSRNFVDPLFPYGDNIARYQKPEKELPIIEDIAEQQKRVAIITTCEHPSIMQLPVRRPEALR
jgi:hypothetical protein